MPAGPEPPPLNPFAAELRRATAGAAAPDKAPSLRELSSISGVGRSAIGDWLSGRSLPRSWDDGAVPVVEAILKIATRCGKRFPDEEAMRRRCKDAYESAKNAPIPGIDVPAVPWEATSRGTADERPEPARPGFAIASVRRRHATYAFSIVATFVILTVALILLLHPAPLTGPSLSGSVPVASGCLDRSGDTSWGAGEIHVCASGDQGSYSGYTTDKEEDDHCVRWRIRWDDKPDSFTPEVCLQQGGTAKFDFEAPAGVSGVRNAFLEQVQISSNTM